MHPEAYKNCEAFAQKWVVPAFGGRQALIWDIGAAIAGAELPNCLRPIFVREDQPAWRYVGIDLAPGPNVDAIWPPPAVPRPDVIVSSSCFEHAGAFWELFRRLVDALEIGGLLWIDAPSAGPVHWGRDSWRFLEDAWAVLAEWDGRVELLESYCGAGAAAHGCCASETWADSVGVYRRRV